MNKISNIVALSCLSLSFTAHAQSHTTQTNYCESDGNNIICSAASPLNDMACQYNSTGSVDNSQMVTVTLQNTEPANFELYPISIKTNTNNDTFTGTITFDNSSTCPLTGGLIAAGATCNIVLDIAAPVCYPTGGGQTGPYNQTLDRELLIGIYSANQSYLSLDLEAFVTPLGSAADFAILSNSIGDGAVNFNPDFGMADVNGNIGASSIVGNYTLTNGTAITDSTALTGPRLDMLSLQKTLIQNQILEGCTGSNSIDNLTSFGPGSYCLDNLDGTNITVGGVATVTPVGPFTVTAKGTYIFYVNPTTPTCGNPIGSDYCNLTFNPDAGVIYQGNATPENVDIFWVVGNANGASGNVIIKTGGTIPGTIITGGTITFDQSGSFISTVIGNLFTFNSAATAINVYGNTISNDPSYLF